MRGRRMRRSRMIHVHDLGSVKKNVAVVGGVGVVDAIPPRLERAPSCNAQNETARPK